MLRLVCSFDTAFLAAFFAASNPFLSRSLSNSDKYDLSSSTPKLTDKESSQYFKSTGKPVNVDRRSCEDRVNLGIIQQEHDDMKYDDKEDHIKEDHIEEDSIKEDDCIRERNVSTC